MAKGFPSDFMDQVGAALTAWQQIDPNLQVGDITFTQAQERATAARAASDRVDALNIQRTAAMADRDDRLDGMRDLVTRLRSVVRGNFGPDSAQYAQVGGTRSSERKPKKRKAKASG
jgi:hypothetical protein